MLLAKLSLELASLISEVIESVATMIVEDDEVGVGKNIATGFAIDENHLITARHAIDGSKRVLVSFADGYACWGSVVATDKIYDLALVRVDRKLKPLKLRDAESVRIGELVVAVGAQLGSINPSFALGIVSAKSMSVEIAGNIVEDLVQIAVGLNHGASGGPVLDVGGRVLGITLFIPARGYGFSYALPSNYVAKFLDLVKKFGRALHAHIGVRVLTLTPGLATLLSIPVSRGLMVVDVVRDSPAERAGIRKGDVIVSVDGRPVATLYELRDAIERAIDRRVVEVELLRRSEGVKKLYVEVEVVDASS